LTFVRGGTQSRMKSTARVPLHLVGVLRRHLVGTSARVSRLFGDVVKRRCAPERVRELQHVGRAAEAERRRFLPLATPHDASASTRDAGAEQGAAPARSRLSGWQDESLVTTMPSE